LSVESLCMEEAQRTSSARLSWPDGRLWDDLPSFCYVLGVHYVVWSWNFGCYWW
jgi:hypothetical protein